MIFSHCDFTQDMEQAVVHLVVDFRKPHDFFSGSALQVSEKTAVFGVFRFIPFIFQHHSSQFLSVEQPLDTVISVTVVEKSDQCTNTSRYQNRNGIVGSPSNSGMEQVKIFPVYNKELSQIQ